MVLGGTSTLIKEIVALLKACYNTHTQRIPIQAYKLLFFLFSFLIQNADFGRMHSLSTPAHILHRRQICHTIFLNDYFLVNIRCLISVCKPCKYIHTTRILAINTHSKAKRK